MAKIVFLSISIILGWLLLIESGVFDALLAFLLIGAVPGTAMIISPNHMLIGIAVIIWLLLVRTTALGTINFLSMKKLIAKHAARQSRLPKRRYSQI